MKEIPSFNALIQKSIIDHWALNALTDHRNATLQYHDVVRKIEKLHILFENSGTQKGDKIALCGRNSAAWAYALSATLTHGAVAVPILYEFTAEQIHNIINHSEAKLLFIGDVIAIVIDKKEMPDLEGIVYIPDYSLSVSRTEKLTYAQEHLNEMFGKKYPKYLRPEHVNYYIEQDPEELALINYTGGTTGFSKGVTIPYRAIWRDADFAQHELRGIMREGGHVLGILPMAHMYGAAFEFIYEFITGCHIFYLTRLLSPAVIVQAYAEIKPALIIAVPLVIEKIIKKRIYPKVQNNMMKPLFNMPVISTKIHEKIRQEVINAFGGNFHEVIISGAAFSKDIENFLQKIGFPYTVGYGTTECAPIIAYANHETFVPGNCGRAAYHIEVKINSNDPQNVPGEVWARGTNVMLGYYKNPKAAAEALDADGWYHTGDLGTMDAEGNIFTKGHLRNMLLGASGQNIYPEEIEDRFDTMPMVNESVVIQENNKLVGLICPDLDEVESIGLTRSDIEEVVEQNRLRLNNELPAYSKLSAIRLHDEEFEKTPKKSIKRYLYQNVYEA